jgi:hypothetical protein
MADFPAFEAKDISEFSGRHLAAYPQGYTPQALKQSVMLFKMATCLRTFPDDDFDAELARYAILSMAEALVLSQPYNAALANPFQSESLGSYSYSKVSGAVMAGVPTGISWFDSAVMQLGICERVEEGTIGGGSSGGIEVFEHQGKFGPGLKNPRLLGPNDSDYIDPWRQG